MGSGQSVAGPLVAMNTILTDSILWVAEKLENQLQVGADLNSAAFAVLKEVMEHHSAVVFGGNGYSEEWHHMAVQERGLPNLPTTADALPVLKEKEIEDLFAKTGVLSATELESRFEVYSEQYVQVIEMEANLVISLAKTVIYPAAVRYLSELASSIAHLKTIGLELDQEGADKVAMLTKSMVDSVSKLSSALHQHDFASVEEHMQYSAKTLRPLMDQVREYADALEGEIADDLWPLPKYQEMLFIK